MGHDKHRRDLLRGGALMMLAGEVATFPAAAAPGTPASRPSPPRPVLAYEAHVTLEKAIAHGRTPYGERFRVPITGGWFKGSDLRGRIVPGGADWQLIRADGYFVIEAEYFMETHDGVQIHVHNEGLWYSRTGDWPSDYAVTTPKFEVAAGRYGWLNQHIFIGTVAPGDTTGTAVNLAIYKMI